MALPRTMEPLNALEGWFKVTTVVREHPLWSVVDTEYVPADKSEAVAPEPPDGDHLYVNGGVPPVTVTVAEPVLAP